MAINTFTGATDSNWGTATNWSQGTVPTAADGHTTTFDGTSPNCTVNTSNRVCNVLTFSGYTNTITMTFGITVSGSITLGSSMVISGTGFLACNATSTLTSNGKTWPNALTLTGAVTHTLFDNWDVDGLLTLGSGTAATTVDGNQISAGAGLTHGGSTSTIAGTTTVVMNGTGSITGSTGGGGFRLNLTINTAGTITISSAQTFSYNTGTMTYIAGTVDTTNSTVSVFNQSTTLAVSGITWSTFTLSGTATMTLSENLVVGGTLNLGSTTATTTINGSLINASGSVNFNPTSGIVTGTTVLTLLSTQTVAAPNITTGTLRLPINLKAGSGTITISTPIYTDLGKVVYTSGSITTTSAWASSGGGSGTPKLLVFSGSVSLT